MQTKIEFLFKHVTFCVLLDFASSCIFVSPISESSSIETKKLIISTFTFVYIITHSEA